MDNKEMASKIKMATICLMAHPDNKPNSQFCDSIDGLIEVYGALTALDDVEQVDNEIEKEASKRYNPNWGGLNGMTENKKFIEGAKWYRDKLK